MKIIKEFILKEIVVLLASLLVIEVFIIYLLSKRTEIIYKETYDETVVKIENKTSEQEIVVFPSVFEEYGGKLVQDNVVKITGRVNAEVGNKPG